MKITAEFNSPVEVLDFINLFKGIGVPIQIEAPKIVSEEAEKVIEEVNKAIEETTAAKDETTSVEKKEETKDDKKEETTITLEEIRARTSKAVKKNREATKEILKEFGASSVSTLEKEHYEAFYEKVGELV